MDIEPDPKNVVGSLIKGDRLLGLFTTERREITLSEFASEAGFNKTTAYRHLQTMVEVGWLTRPPSGGYRLGKRLLVLGAIARADVNLRQEALPVMRALAEKTGDTAFLMIPGPQGAVIVETVVGTHPVQVNGLVPGAILPYHVAAGPIALAAFSPDVEARVLGSSREQFTSQTATTTAALRERFRATRADGYALSYEDYIEGVAAVGAPVIGDRGVAVAALSVGGPINRFKPSMRAKAISLVIEAAESLSEGIGN